MVVLPHPDTEKSKKQEAKNGELTQPKVSLISTAAAD